MLSRRIATAVSLALAVLVVAGVGASSAFAGEAHPFLTSFGSLSNPNGIAVDESTGDVYVAAIGTDTVYKFDARGNPVDFSALGSNSLTGSATPAGSFSFPEAPDNPAAIAVDNSTSPSDPSTGDIYVLDAGHEVIDKFSPSGSYLGQITGPTPEKFSELLGVGVDASGNVRVDVYNNERSQSKADVFGDSGANVFVTSVEFLPLEEGEGDILPAEHGFAVSSTGDGYPLFSCGCVEKLDQKSEVLGKVDSSSDVAAAFDRATGHIYVDDQSSVAEWDPGEMNGGVPSPSSMFAYLSSGTLVSTFGSLQLVGSSGQGGIAVNGANGNIYVSNPTEGTIDVFSTAVASVAVGTPVNVTQTSATLEGAVDPNGAPIAFCRFAYEAVDSSNPDNLRLPVTNFGQSVPCAQTPA
jgi:DNA-binding beta-propeller fold protein YncE